MNNTTKLPRDVAQMLIEKLDLESIRPIDAKSHALRIYRVELSGHTRSQVVKSIGKNMEDIKA